MIDTGLTPQAAAQRIAPDMLDEKSCRQWVIGATRGSEPRCPSCGDLLAGSDVARLLDGKSITCAGCGVKSSARTGTILEGSALTDRQLVFILALLHWELPVYHIARLAGCAPATVYNWMHRMGIS